MNAAQSSSFDYGDLRRHINFLGTDQKLTNLAKKLDSRERYIMMTVMDQSTGTSPDPIQQKEITNLAKKLRGISNEELTFFEKIGNNVNYLSNAIFKITPRNEYVKSENLSEAIFRFNKTEALPSKNVTIEPLPQEKKTAEQLLLSLNEEIEGIRSNTLEATDGLKNEGLIQLLKAKLGTLEELKTKNIKAFSNTNDGAQKISKPITLLNIEILSVLDELKTETTKQLKSTDNKKPEIQQLNTKILQITTENKIFEADERIGKAKRNLVQTESTDKEKISQLNNNLTYSYKAKIATLGNLQAETKETIENGNDKAAMLKSLNEEKHKTEIELQEMQRGPTRKGRILG